MAKVINLKMLLFAVEGININTHKCMLRRNCSPSLGFYLLAFNKQRKGDEEN